MVHPLARLLRLTQFVATLLVVGLSAALYHYLSGFIHAGEWVQHTQEELVQIEKARTEVLRSEILLRSYLSAPSPGFLSQLHTATAEMREVMERLEALRHIEHHEPQEQQTTQALLQEMQGLQRAYLAVINLAERQDTARLAQHIRTHVQTTPWHELHKLLDEIERSERRDLQQRHDVQTRHLHDVKSLLLKVALLGGGVLLWALWRSEQLLRLGRNAVAQLAENALRDPLTGLLNRRELYRRLARLAREAAPQQAQAAVLLFDLDDFKPVNDRYGHAAGDEVLKVVGARLRAHCREPDLVARLGGDEFVVVLSRIDSREAALGMAKRLRLKLQDPVDIGGVEARVDVSIGVAMLPADGCDPDQLLQVADAGMYRAKHGGKGGVAVAAASGDAATATASVARPSHAS